MELDKRIKPNKMPLTCFDIKKAKEFVGKWCYVSFAMEQFENLNKCAKVKLTSVEDYPTPFTSGDKHFCFAIPCDWVEDPNDVETLKKTITELRQKVAEQEKIIAQLNGIETRKESATEEPHKKEIEEFFKNLEKLLGE